MKSVNHPIQINHPSIRTNDTALPSDELLEPPPVSRKEPTTCATRVGHSDETNSLVVATSTSATTEPPLSVEILTDSDCVKTNEDENDEDFSTVVLVDKGKGVDRWFPKISPYRFTVFLTPLAIGIVKAVLSHKGSVTTPITLEWINGVVIFLL